MILFLSTINLPKKEIIAIISCIIFAILDETHQIFSNGRTPQVLDIIIDSIGSTLGITIINILKRKKRG